MTNKEKLEAIKLLINEILQDVGMWLFAWFVFSMFLYGIFEFGSLLFGY